MTRAAIIVLLVSFVAGCEGGGSDPCAGFDCGAHGACADLNGVALCVCEQDYLDEGDGCIHSKLVDCADVTPANARSTLEQVEVTYTTSGGWSDPAECPWTCDDGLVASEGACQCPADSVDEGAGCISTKLVDCTDVAPANASSTVEQVEITYSSADGWSDPAACAWICDEGHTEVNGACLCSPGSCVGGVCDQAGGACVPDVAYPAGPYGVGVGDVVEDAVLPEADGYDVALADAYTLYQATGRPKVLILNFSEVSCSPSQAAASDYPQFRTDYVGGGGDPGDIEHITILCGLDGVDYSPATVQQASNWKNLFGLTSPVVVDPDLTVFNRFAPAQTPTFWIIDPASMQVEDILDGYAGWQDIGNRIAPIIAVN